MDYKDIVVEHRGAVSWLYLNRPKALNAISIPCMMELIEAAKTLRDRRETRVIVVSGKGRGFCAGADLTPAPDGADGWERGFLEYGAEFELLLSTMPKPVIAALNGVTCGGGLELGMMCDFMIACESAKIGDAHANFGVIPGGGATVRLARIVGVNQARYLMYTGDLFPAREAFEMGLVTRVVADDALETEVQALAEKIAAKSPLGLQRMKQLVLDAFDMPTRVAINTEKLVSNEHMRSHDAQEGGQAFMEKRKPEFKGI